MEPEELRDAVARYWVAYYGEVESILNTVSWSSAEIPTHFIPQPRTIRLHQARDGFIVEHFNRDPGTGPLLAFEVYPPTDRTIRELTGGSLDYREGAPIFWSMSEGRRLGHSQHGEALRPDFRQRYEIITNEHISKLTEEEARKNARVDLELYLEIL
jgi:hypothetical protein